MRLDNERESDYIEDRRGSSGGFAGGFGGGGLNIRTLFFLWPLIRMLLRTKFGWAIIAFGALAYFTGFNPLSLLNSTNASNTHISKNSDKEAIFIKKVLASTEDVWKKLLPKYGIRYQEPTVVLYSGHTTSGCGFASAQMGPFYCPADRKIYLDLNFFNELAKRHNAPGDFAQAYVLAHEVGHHVQNILGTLSKVQQLKQRLGGGVKANALQVRVELQADCYAGIWGHYANKEFNQLEPGDLQEALNAASAIGDDTLQKEAQGYVRPETFTHGSSAQRAYWFKRGFDSGDLRACNTFK